MAEQPGGSDRDDEDASVLTDRDDVRRWADERNLAPVRRESGGERETDLVPRDQMGPDHEEREMDAFLDEFEEENLGLAYTDAGGESPTGQYRLVDRTEAIGESGELEESILKELLEGETVETTVTEREVVETEVVDEATIESEIVDSMVVDSTVVDTEIVDEEIAGIAMVEATDAEVVGERDRTYFDDDEGVVRIEEQGTVALEINEERIETEEQIEEKIIESRIVESDVEEETRVEDESLDVNVDVAGIHEHIGQSGLVDTHADDVIDDRYIETEFSEDDLATSTLTEHKTVENVVNERKVLYADISDVDIEDSRVVTETVVETDIVESDVDAVPGRETGESTTMDATEQPETGESTTMGATEQPETGEMPEGTGTSDMTESAGTGEGTETSGTGVRSGERVEITERATGRTVETRDGDEIGIVSDVDVDRGVYYVDENPSITDKIKAELDWGDTEDDTMLQSDQIAETRRDAIVVKGSGRGE